MECRKNTQFAVNGFLTLPKDAPDIDFILRVTSTPKILKTMIMDKQISFSGHVIICIEFVSSKPGSPQTVHFISFETPFISLINHCCAKTGMDCQLSASIKQQDFQLINSKCINKLIVIKVCVLRLTKSCNGPNSHCSEPHLTLLCTPDKLKTCASTQLSKQTTDSTNVPLPKPPFTDFHLPFTQQIDSPGHNNSYKECDYIASYNSCGCQIDHD